MTDLSFICFVAFFVFVIAFIFCITFLLPLIGPPAKTLDEHFDAKLANMGERLNQKLRQYLNAKPKNLEDDL